jgi:O-antigen/teichoic acid export membrane protein
MVSVLMGSAAIFLVFFGNDALRLWTGNPTLASKAAPLVALLAMGALFNGLMGIPYQLQIAYGWTSLAVRITTVGVCLQIPILLLVIPAFGAVGAASTWLGLNILYVVVGIPLTHRRLLTTEQFAWFRDDFILPLGSSTIAAFLLRIALRQNFDRFKELVILGAAAACIVIVAMIFAPAIRNQIRIFLFRKAKPINAWTG